MKSATLFSRFAGIQTLLGPCFVPFVAVVPVGGSVRFVNLDRFDDIPDGQANVRPWHPDQLVEQPMPGQVAARVEAGAKLNFTPRRRAAPRPKGEYALD